MARARPRRAWLLIAALIVAALLNAATWAGLGMGAFVLWDFVHAYYFQQSYAAGPLPAAVAGGLVLAALLLVLRRPGLAAVPAFAAMVATAVLVTRLGNASPLHAYLHPMQLVIWGAMALTVIACLWLFSLNRQRAATPSPDQT